MHVRTSKAFKFYFVVHFHPTIHLYHRQHNMPAQTTTTTIDMMPHECLDFIRIQFYTHTSFSAHILDEVNLPKWNGIYKKKREKRK